MLITPELLYAFNGTHVDMNDEAAAALVWINIGAAQQIINDYVGFDSEEVMADPRYTDAERSLFQKTALRIATLLQNEGGGNIGISAAASEMSVTRTYLNTTDYTAYLRPLSSFRRNGGVW